MLNRASIKITGTVLLSILLSGRIAAALDEQRFTVSGESAKDYVEYLAAHEMQGRKSCTEGYSKAAEWVAAKFKEWGLKPAGEEGSYFQKVTFSREFDWTTGVPELSVNGRAFLLDDEDFSIDSLSTAGTEVEGEIVFVGYGISAPGKGLDEYDGVEMQGRIALVLKGSPHSAPEPRASQPDSDEGEGKVKDEWAEESKDQAKIKTAYDKGAAAILLYDPDPPEQDPRTRYRYSRRSRGSSLEPERDFLCFTVEARVFRAIMKKDPQETPRGFSRRIDGMRRAIKEKKACSRRAGSRASLKGYDSITRHSAKNGNNIARNVLAKIEGTDPVLKNEYILLGAHLDHLGLRNDYVYNGADDNASGSAVVMEVGRVLAESGFKPKRTVICCCWCGEELGLVGSYHYTRNPCDGVSMDRIVACFNMDMVGLGDSLRVSGALNFPGIWEVIKRDQDPELMKIIQASVGGPGGSDHSGFIVKGIEAMMLIAGGGAGHPDYHQPEDDAEKIDPEMLQKTGQFVLQGVMNLANETGVNLLIENREQLYMALRMEFSKINPDLPDSTWKVVAIDAESREALQDKIVNQALEVVRKEPSRSTTGSGRSGGPEQGAVPVRRSVTRGLSDLSVFKGDLKLMELATEFYGIGRVDIKGDDGAWIVEGRLTESGREALKLMESKGIAVHMVSPKEELINDLLSACSKPFLITGDYTITESMADRIVEKGVLLGIDFDPENVNDFIDRLEKVKNQVGKRELLVAYLTSTEALDGAKKPLYMGLIEKGWAHREICGTRRRRGGITGGNLSALDSMRGGRQ